MGESGCQVELMRKITIYMEKEGLTTEREVRSDGGGAYMDGGEGTRGKHVADCTLDAALIKPERIISRKER